MGQGARATARRLPLILAACAVAVAMLAFLWVRREPARALPPGAAEPRSGGASAELLAQRDPALPSATVAPPAAEVERRAVTAEADPSAAPSRRVRVVLASTGAPVQEARVWIEEDVVDRPLWLQMMRRFNDIEPVLQNGFGRELGLDARGEARVPRPARELWLVAAHGELHGEASLRPADAECVIELQPYHALSALVVDRAGRPLEDAIVALYGREEDPWGFQWSGMTDAQGRARISKLESQVRPEGDRGPFRLTLALVACEPAYASLAFDELPAEPVRFVAEDSGRVVVQLTDAQGQDLALDGFASLEIVVESATDLPANLGLSWEEWMRIQAGRAVYPHVGLGLSLSLYADAQGYEGGFREVLGPTSPGEEVLVKMPVRIRAAQVRGRVVGIDRIFGSAFPRGARLRGTSEAGSGFFEDWLSEDGAFERELQSAEGPGELTGPWLLELSGSGGPLLRQRATPALDEEETFLDFGLVTFTPPSELVRVRVLGQGQPVADALVEVGPSSPYTLWCDEQGRCALNGDPAGLPVTIRGTCNGWLPSAWVEVREPDGELALELRPGAALEGRLLLPDGGDPTDFGLKLWIEAAPGLPPAKPERAELVEGGRFRFAPCEPGRARLAIAYGTSGVHEQAGIELRAGETTDLGEIDLRALLQPFELSFALAGGEPWRDGALVVREPDGSFPLWLPIGDTGRVRFLAQRPRVDLWAVGRGGSVAFFEGVSSGQHLTLPPPASASLRLAPGAPLPAPPLALIVRGERLLPESVEWASLDFLSAEGAVGLDGSARLAAPCAGTYELAWLVVRADTGAEFAVELAEPQTVVVPEPPEEPVIMVSLPAEAVERAVLEAGG